MRSRYVEGGTAPGKIMLAALLASAPVAAVFVFGPLIHRDELPILVMGGWRKLFLAATPVLAAVALVLYYRAPPEARLHNAARFGRIVSIATAALWLLYAPLYLFVLRGPF